MDKNNNRKNLFQLVLHVSILIGVLFYRSKAIFLLIDKLCSEVPKLHNRIIEYKFHF